MKGRLKRIWARFKNMGAADILSLTRRTSCLILIDMTKAHHITAKQIEDRALALGASAAAVYKWRERGIPSKWQIKLIIDSKGAIKLEDFEALKIEKGDP